MSRIHDALKKAEEEKMSGKSPATSPGAEQVHEPAAEAAVEVAAVAGAPLASAVRLAEDHAASAESITQRCTTVQWHPDRRVALFMDAQSQVGPGMEEFRTLRARLFQMRTKKPLKTILIASALPDEGKSFVAGNLAQVFAKQRGGKTLLLDCDLRKPQLHEMLGAPKGPGISEYLQGKVDEFSIVQKSSYDDLFFIPGGEVTPSSPELIGNGRLKLLLKELAPSFSWIVVDSSPTAPVSDASRLAEFCDGVLLVVRAASTPASMADLAKREFRDTPILGVVLNQVSRTETTYSKYYYTQYGQGKER
ncbi:MAG TPA: CpsD/CapB family tyrosine-protein kinase [Terriglobales bacterium]|nr:CpsD/CapB family tyrosine-protein kinase [Terriglobales bacterium]